MSDCFTSASVDTLFRFDYDLSALASDQVREFDAYLRVPIRDRAAFTVHIRGYDEYRQSRALGKTRDMERIRLIKALESIANGGEDVDRLAKWVLSMQEPDVKTENLRATWAACIGRWYHKGVTNVVPSYVEQVEQIANTYWGEVQLPFFLDFDRLLGQSNERWLAGPANRSDFDNYLYDSFYGDSCSTPMLSFESGIFTVLQQSWFFNLPPELKTPAVSEAIFEAAQQLIHSGELSVRHKGPLEPLECAFALRSGYRFEDYCRDW